jgi:hypothetical protein
MMIHEFFILNDEKILDNSGWWKNIRKDLMPNINVIEIHDDVVVNNKLFLKGFKSFKVSFTNPGEGLDYHGITIIPNTSLQEFQNNVTKAKEGINPQLQKQLDELLRLCETAIKEGKYIIHFGL